MTQKSLPNGKPTHLVMSHSILLDCGIEALNSGSVERVGSIADQNDISPGAVDH